ncbi:MAG TPA: hypothetical protein VFT57_02915 [Gemmatimonadaceae bacterium]|nr:hypothetical protein [Gemmatimonadaceae bacterium]
MKALAVMLGSALIGGLGWWAGSPLGIFASVTLSAVGSGLGIYLVRRLWNEYLP